MAKQIPLSQGKVALVDDADYEWLSQWKWRAARNKQTFYAQHNQRSNGRVKTVLMHRIITQFPQGVPVDHIDGNGLNNTRANLRASNTIENSQNRKIQSNNRSGYKGVAPLSKTTRWQAAITVQKRRFYLGYFDTPEAAARAYDDAARLHFGEFARLNFPESE